MELYKRIIEEASGEAEAPGYREETRRYTKSQSLLAPGAGGYVTVEDLEQEEQRLERERIKIQEMKKRASETRALRAFARQGVHSPWQGMVFRALQRKFPAEWDSLKKW